MLQINSVCGIGSTGRIVTDLCSELESNNFECLVLYGRGKKSEATNAIKFGNKLSLYYHVLLTRIFDLHGFGSKYFTIKMLKVIEEFKPDIIHLHNIHGYYINIEIFFKYLKKIDVPIVWTLHDCWPFSGHCAHFDFSNCVRWRNGCFECVEKRKYPASFLLDRSKKNWELKKDLFTNLKNVTIVTPSIWLANLVKESFLQKFPIQVINNGIDTSKFLYKVNSIKDKFNIRDKFVLLGVANVWDKRKGLYDFMELSKKIDDSKFAIILVGVSEKQTHFLPKNIIAIKRTSNIQELAEIYSGVDLFLNLTYEDNYPTTNLEARACGTQVLTYNTGGSPESAGKDAIIIEKGNLNDVIDKIFEIAKNERKSVCDCKINLNSKKKMMLEYMELYMQCINENGVD